VYSTKTNDEVTIIGKSRDSERRLVVKGDTEILIVNEPVEEEVVPNHFLAYYNLFDPAGCCTNILFPFKRSGCDPNNGGVVPKILLTHGGHVGLTVACSNSTYP
jgi:hypothetical protein